MTRPARMDGRERDGQAKPLRPVTIDRPRYWTQAEWASYLRLMNRGARR